MDRAGGPDAPGDRRTAGRAPVGGRRAGRHAPGHPARRLPAPQAAQGGGAGDGSRGGQPPDLPTRPARARRDASRARRLLDAGARQLQGPRRTGPTGGRMSTQAGATTIRHEIVVRAPQERAFTVFTTQFDAIKPKEHNLLAADIEETVLEPRVGGYIYDRGVDGSVCRWARVLAFEPPDRIVFSWDIGPRWEI